MKKAFTLAEVLITLTIIGVIAVLTIPNLMRKWEDRTQIAGMKQAYTILNQAFRLAVRENGPLTDWDWPYKNTSWKQENSIFLENQLAPYLKIERDCSYYNKPKCYKETFGIQNGQNYYYKVLNGTYNNNHSSITYATHGGSSAFFVLKNNMYVRITFAMAYKNQNGLFGGADTKVLVDINGPKGPNRYGYDVFFFGINEYGLTLFNSKNYCNVKNSNWGQSALSCSYWIIKHGNMDYKYRDVSAEW